MYSVMSQHYKGFALFDTIKRIREKNAQLFCASAIILALSISGCTTSSGTNLLENAAADIAAAESNEASGDGTTTNGATATKAAAATNTLVPATNEAKQLAATQTETPVQIASAETTAITATQAPQTPVTTAQPEQPATLAALFGTRNKPTAALAAAEQVNTTTASQPKPQANTAQTEAEKPESTARTAPAEAAPNIDRTSQSAGAAARLFSSGKNSPRGNNKEATVTASAAPAKRTSEYNYTLPGVRANGGIEIRHSNKVFDESDIDLDEDDFSAPVTLASAGGMARLAPNGLRTHHDKVQVSCLKPQLVSMIKRLESHYRKPVVITSGYRSPSHNRSVSGAKRSLHMSCAAADLQIPGVSKWEIARQVRTWPGRGGVGTYCHTESVHIDVGPERDWNWRCRRK